MISRCTCDCTLSLSPLLGRPSWEKSLPVSLSLMRFMTATARSLSTSLASPSCPYAFKSSRSRASRRGRLGASFGSDGTLLPLPELLLFRSGTFSSAATQCDISHRQSVACLGSSHANCRLSSTIKEAMLKYDMLHRWSQQQLEQQVTLGHAQSTKSCK